MFAVRPPCITVELGHRKPHGVVNEVLEELVQRGERIPASPRKANETSPPRVPMFVNEPDVNTAPVCLRE